MKFEAVTFTCFMVTVMCVLASTLATVKYLRIEFAILTLASIFWLALQLDLDRRFP